MIPMFDPETQTLARGFWHFLSLTRDIPIDVSSSEVRLDEQFVSKTFRQYLAIAKAKGKETVKERLPSPDELSVPIVTTSPVEPSSRFILMAWQKAGKRRTAHYGALKVYMQWLALRESFVRSGVRVVSPMTSRAERESLPDIKWVRDTFFILDDIAYFPEGSRHSESDDFWNGEDVRRIRATERLVKRLGIKTVRVSRAFFEGGNLVLHRTGKQIFWSNLHCEIPADERARLAKAIYRHQGETYDIIPVVSHMPHFHLDLALSEELSDGSFLVDPTWHGAQRVREHVGRERMIFLERHAPTDCVTNLVPWGQTLFMTSCPLYLREKLEMAGHIVNAPENEDLRSPVRKIGNTFGGGVRCLSQKIG